jgi:hypothetical protein
MPLTMKEVKEKAPLIADCNLAGKITKAEKERFLSLKNLVFRQDSRFMKEI